MSKKAVYEEFLKVIYNLDLTILNITPSFNKYAFLKKIDNALYIYPSEDLLIASKIENGVIFNGKIIDDKIMITHPHNLPYTDKLVIIDHADRLFEINKLREYFFELEHVVLLNYLTEPISFSDYNFNGVMLNYLDGLNIWKVKSVDLFISLIFFFSYFNSRPMDIIVGNALSNLLEYHFFKAEKSFQKSFIGNKIKLQISGIGKKRLIVEQIEDAILDEYQEDLDLIMLGEINFKERIKELLLSQFFTFFFDYREIINEFKVRRDLYQ